LNNIQRYYAVALAVAIAYWLPYTN